MDNNLPLFVVNQLVTILYLATTFLYGAHFFMDMAIARQFKQPALITTVIVHVFYLGFLTSTQGYQLSYSTLNLMTMVGFTLTSIYLLTEFTTKSDKSGFFIISFAAGAQLLSSLLITQVEQSSQTFSGLSSGLHLLMAIFSFSSIAIAGIYSLLYLLLFRQIQQNRFELFFQRLPNLEVLEMLCMHAVSLGFLFISLTLLSGLWAQSNTNVAIAVMEPKFITMAVIWLIYGAGMFIKPFKGWDMKHMAYLLIFLFLFVTLLIVLMTLSSPTFHSRLL
uniref:HemX protein, putative n=1 Tax=Chlorobium chlorochromatii (strain CaD3) TaxID=340177 RepID=Q3AQF3_CHLCH